MNIKTERRVVDRCLQRLEAIVGAAPSLAKSGVLRLKGPWGSANFEVEVRARMTSESLATVLPPRSSRSGSRSSTRLILAPYVNPSLAERLRAEGLHFVDAAGNASIRQGGLFVWVSGRRDDEPVERPVRAFQATGLRLVALLLHRPESVALTYRELATSAGVSLGSVGPMLEDLRRAGHVRTRDGRRSLANRRALLERWELGYLETLRPKAMRRTCRPAAGATVEELVDRIERAGLRGRVQVGGELAAARLTGHLRPERATLHLVGVSAEEVMARLRLLPDASGSVDLAEGVLREGEPDGITASAVMVHAELLRGAADERLRETARVLFEQHLRERMEG